MSNKKALAIGLAATMLLSLPLAGCTDNGQGTAPTEPSSPADAQGGKKEEASGSSTASAEHDFVVATSSDVKTLDPHGTNDTSSSLLHRHIYDRLIELDEEGNMIPGLAEKWEKVSDTEYKFKLREGVKFHNGEELKASDVKFSIEREKQGARTTFLVEKVKEVRVDGDYEFTLILSEPDGSILNNLTHSGGSILNEKAVTEAGESYAQHPIGTGPLQFKEWVPNDHITLERFDDYYNKTEDIVKSLTFRVIPEQTARTIALENGEVDVIPSVAPVDIARVQENASLHHEFRSSPSIEFMGFNFEREPFNNTKVRQAIAHAIDRQSLVDVAQEGYAEVVDTVVGKAVPGYDETVQGYEYDIEKAKSLLAEAGYPDGFSTTITTSGEVRSQEAQIIQSNLAEIGIQVEIELMEWGAYLEALNNNQMDMYILGWSNTTLDPAVSLYPLFHSRNWGATGNRMHYKNDEVDALLDEMMRESDNDKRLALSSQIQHKVMEDAPWVPFLSKQTCIAYTNGIENIKLMPSELHVYAYMKK